MIARAQGIGTVRWRRGRAGAGVALALLVCAIPLWCTSYQLFQLTLVIVSSIALLGLNLLTGYGGQISLGHGAFYGIGAYTTAILGGRSPLWLPRSRSGLT